MHNRWTVILITLLFAFAGWNSANAKEGLYVGLDLVEDIPEQDLRGDFAKVDPGAGLDVKLGYIFQIPIAIELELGATGHRVKGDNAGIGFFVLDFRYFPFVFSDRPLYPYIRAGVGKYALVIRDFKDAFGRTDDLKLTGNGFDIGIGFDFYINSNASFDVGLTQRFVTYNDIDYLDSQLTRDVKGSMTSLNVGLQYHF